MIRHGLLLLCLLAASLIATGTVHARESLAAPAFECSGVMHSDGDADQVPGDSDSAIPHHHSGCHGFSACIDPASDHADIRVAGEGMIVVREPLGFARWSSGPHLRPPIA